jgi:hypothetical protein
MAFIFDINTNLNENNKEMSKLTDLRSQVDMYIIYVFVCAIFADIIVHVCVLFVGRGQSINCDNFLSNPIAVLFAIK